MVSSTIWKKACTSEGPITWSIFNPGVELSPVDRVEILYDYMEDFNPGPGLKCYTFPPLEVTKMWEILKDGCRKYEAYRNVCFFSIWGVNNLDITAYNAYGHWL